MRRSATVTLALILLAPGCTKGNPLFDALTNGDGDAGTSAAPGSSTAEAAPGTDTTPTTGDTSGGGTAELSSASTDPIDSTGLPAATTGDPSTGDMTTGSSGGDDTTSTTSDGTSGGDTGDGLLDLGEHTLVAAAHCVGIDPQQDLIVTLSAAECGPFIAKEELAAQQANLCPGLDPAQFGRLAVDFYNNTSDTYNLIHLRFKFPEKLPPGTKAVNGVLTLTAGCNAQYAMGKPDNIFKPGDVLIDACDKVPKLDGDKHPMGQPPAFPVESVQEVGGKVNGALEPGERVEWKIKPAELNTMVANGSDLCVSIWQQWQANNNVHYQGSDGPAPPRLVFTVQAL